MAKKKPQAPVNVLNTPRPGTNHNGGAEWRKIMKNTDPGPAMKMLSMLERFEQDKDQIKIAPDTTGVDYYFLQNFINWNMDDEFWAIATDFLHNCYTELPEFAKLGWAFPQDLSYISVYEKTQQRILNLILNGARSGNNYCIELLKYLYKTYYKREYNQLKRFRTITLDELFTIADSDEREDKWGNIAVLLTMCPLFDIEMHERCGLMYMYLDEKRKESEQEVDELFPESDLRKECDDIMEAWITEDMKKPERKRQKTYWENDEFLSNCFRYMGEPADLLWGSGLAGSFGKSSWSALYTILKVTFPKREFTYEEVQQYAHIYQLAEAFTEFMWEYRDTVISLLGLHQQEFFGEYEGYMFFKPEAVLGNAQRKQSARGEVSKSVITNMAPIAIAHASEEDYMAEISELRHKLREQEQQNKNLREQYQIAKKELKEVQTQLEKCDQDREELIALRNHVYQESQEIKEIPENDLESMKKAIAGHTILIVGGHVNWHNRLKQLFPKWKFIDIHYYHTVDVKVVEGVEKVYFFTDYLSHITYRKMINVIRDKRVEFGYVANVNMERFVKQVYEDMEG